MPRDAKPRVLFVCGRNSARSQMAEGLLRAAGGGRVEVESAGVEGSTVHPMAVEVMREIGIDISTQRSKAVRDLGGRTFDLVVTLCDQARGLCIASTAALDDGSGPDQPSGRSPVLSGVPVLVHWSVDDPVDGGSGEPDTRERFRAARDVLGRNVECFVEDGYLDAMAALHGRWERLLDTLDEGIIAHDSARRIFLANRAAERILGLSREQILGRDCHAVLAPDGLCGSQCSFCTAGAPDVTGRLEYEVDLTARDGADKRVRMTVSPLEIEPGRTWGVIAAIRDLTEVSRLRGRLALERGFEGMIGVSPAMRGIFETIRQISTSDYPVLVTGESGTGKELVAGAIHSTSRRRSGPFVPINCGALPDNILESELFGHVRGAFTGAIRDKKGRFELADSGTIFLDEVGELSPSFQVKLLRVLEEKSFERVGGERPVHVDVRIVSATNRDLRAMVAGGRFREDLFYRLCVVPIDLPPLRGRVEDIPLLVEHALELVRAESQRPVRRISDEALSLLVSYGWPGNVRELISALQFASVGCAGDEILPQHLPLEIRKASGPPRRMVAIGVRPGRRRKLARAAVEAALAEAGGNRARAARILGVGRATLYRFLAGAGQ